jgi:hypothetical protein
MIKRVSRRPRPFAWLAAIGLVLGISGLSQAAGPNPGGDALVEGEMAIGPGASAFIYYSEPILQVVGTCQGTPFAFQSTDEYWPLVDRQGNLPAPTVPTEAKDLVGFTYSVPSECALHAPHSTTGEFIVSSVSDFFSDGGTGAWPEKTFSAQVQMLWVVENPSPN